MKAREILVEFAKNRDVHNAKLSLKEELVAIAAYEHRIKVAQDPELIKILIHNRDEEKKHAAMLRAWLQKA